MSNERKISNAILVKDDSVKDIRDSEILSFLKEQKFDIWKIKDYPACNWIYISMNDKTYMPGIPGVPITSSLGEHAITVDEFMEIYEIFSKYEDLEVLCMSREEEIRKKMNYIIADKKRKEFFKNLSFDEYYDLCKQIVRQTVREDEPEKYIDAFMQHEMDTFRRSYHSQTYPESLGYPISLLYERYETEDEIEKNQEVGMQDVLESVDLDSQMMNINITVFHDFTQDEDGKKYYSYRFLAEDEATTHYIDIDLEDRVGDIGIGDLYLAFDECEEEREMLRVYSWGHVEFMPYCENGCKHLTVFVYPGEIPDENEEAMKCNYFCLEFDEEEFNKVKDFLFQIYQKIYQTSEK